MQVRFLPVAPMDTEIKIVISGSFRKHLSDIGRASENFKKAGIEILAPLTQEVRGSKGGFIFLASDDKSKAADTLERDFIDNIKKANFHYVANVEGYVGRSAAVEMGAAIMSGIPIIVAEKIKVLPEEVPGALKELFQKMAFGQLPIDQINQDTVARLDLTNHTSTCISSDETTLLQSQIEKLLEDLKLASMTA